MATKISETTIVEIHSELDGVSIKVEIVDGTIMKILFEVDSEKGITRFLLPHSNTPRSIETLKLQLEDILEEIGRGVGGIQG